MKMNSFAIVIINYNNLCIYIDTISGDRADLLRKGSQCTSVRLQTIEHCASDPCIRYELTVQNLQKSNIVIMYVHYATCIVYTVYYCCILYTMNRTQRTVLTVYLSAA